MGTARVRTFDVPFWTFLLMNQKLLQHHLDLTSLVTELAIVLDLFNESPNYTVGHAGWHGLAASGAVLYSLLARSAHDMSRWTTWKRKISRNVVTNLGSVGYNQ